jgi:sugar/nucleoside kinase (ribokinase family)
MSKVLAIGNALVDILIRVKNEELLQEFNLDKGSMQLVNKDMVDLIVARTRDMEKVMASGGSASNTIHALAKLGIDTSILGKIGQDEIGQFFKKDMETNHVNANLLTSDTLSGRAMAFISPDGERTFATYLGAAVELTEADLNEKMFQGYSYFHVEGYLVQNNVLIETALKLAKKAGLKVSIDMASYNVVDANIDFLKRIVDEYVDIAFLNEEEALSFTGKEPEEAVHEIARSCGIAVVKIGKEGSLIKKGDKLYKVAGIPAKTLDTTGAGDVYAAGFIYGLIEGLDLVQCGKIGSLVASKVVEVMGAKLSNEQWHHVKKEIENIKNT